MDQNLPRPKPVRLAVAADRTPVAAMLARAFADNPLVRWMVPDDAMYDAIGTEFFGFGLDRELVMGEVYTTDDYAGAALWLPPGSPSPGILEQVQLGWRLLRLLGRRTWATAGALSQFEEQRPKRDHWYLTILGTEPNRQGTGIGTHLLAPVLERCDRDGVAAYLESSNPDNVSYYRRFGFQVTAEIPFADGPTIPVMLREPHRR